MSQPKLDMLGLNDSNVDLFMYLTRLGSVHEKFDVWTGPNCLVKLVKLKHKVWKIIWSAAVPLKSCTHILITQAVIAGRSQFMI